MNRQPPLLFAALVGDTDADKLDNKIYQDPLNGVGNDLQETFKPINSVVFAEPINYHRTDADQEDIASSEEIRYVDNIIIQKKVGKRNKYHMNIEDLSNPKCPQQNCDKSFSSLTLLKAHIRKVHCADKSRYMCEECGSGFSAVYLLRRHSVVHRGDRVQCPVCKKLLSARTNLSTHLRSHADTRSHVCVTCQKRFVRKCTLDAHVKFVHRVGELGCDKCDATFTSRSKWSRHNLSHADVSRDAS